MKALWLRFWTCLACLFGGMASASQNVSGEQIGMVGSKLATVQKTSDLFTFFNFAPVGEEKTPGTTSFKPTGDAFRALVTLDVTTDAQGIITKLDLSIARSFIDDPKKCIYAADLAKSFLADAAPTSSSDEVGSLG
jgi:hypothetical protein